MYLFHCFRRIKQTMNTPMVGPSCWPLLRSTLDLLMLGTTKTTHLSHTSLADLTHLLRFLQIEVRLHDEEIKLESRSDRDKQINRQASKQINKHDICTTECIHASVQVFHQSFPSGSARCSKPWNALLHILQKQGKSQINKKTKTDK